MKDLKSLTPEFKYWEKIKDIADQYIDLMLNYRQSGHPGGSRSKMHTFVTLLLSGAMRWDIRHPEKRFADRFILVAGHTNPLIYAVLSVFYDAMRVKYKQTGNEKFKINLEEKRALYPEDLVTLRYRDGLPGHAEMIDKTLFFKFNTGPSGHGGPAAAGVAAALKLSRAGDVRVFAMEGEGGATAGAIHETKNSAWGLGLDNLYYLFDWNDYGIDDHAVSSVVNGTPKEWFGSYGWRVFGTEYGMEWDTVTKVMEELINGPNPLKTPSCGYFKTRKGRDYGVFDNKSHGAAHKMNSDLFWETKRVFAEKYNVEFEGFGQPAPGNKNDILEQALKNLKVVSDVLQKDEKLVDYITVRLVDLGDSVPVVEPRTFRLGVEKNPIHDSLLYNYKKYPTELYAKPGEKAPNRAALSKWGAWVNAYCAQNYDRPLFIAMSADLADSTNISGFAKPFGDFKGYGWYERNDNPDGSLLPQEITEFTNSGICVGMASVNLHSDPEKEFNGFFTACSTYGSFSYLKYGLMRLFSQLAQDSPLKVGKVIWVAGHSGPETAEDSRTHFGVFAPAVTQLFPEGKVINLYPWEHNEVPVLLGEALSKDVPIIALHLTRPPIEIPDRDALGIASHFEAAKGAYIMRAFRKGEPRQGTVIVLGTSSTMNVVKIIPELDRLSLNVKIVCATSPELFKMQDDDYKNKILPFNEWMDSMTITNGARRTMHDWICNKVSEEYSLSSDWDNQWRGGGSIDTVVEDAHLSPEWILRGIQKFVQERDTRLSKLSIK